VKSQPVTQSTSQQNTIPAWLTQAGQGVVGKMGQLPSYSAYTGPGPAGLTPQQIQALGLSSSNVGQGQAIAGQAYNPLNSLTGFGGQMIDPTKLGADTQSLMSPYIQSVIDPATAAIDRNTQQAMNQADTNLAAQHAFGGSRQGVADATVATQGALQKSQLTSQLMSQGYSAAQAEAMAEQQSNQTAAQNAAGTRLSAANALSGLGSNISGLNTSDLQNLLAAGGVGQQSQTAQNLFQYQNWMNNMQMPGQMLAQQAGILGSLPHDTSQTGQSTQMSYSNPLMGLAGLGLGLGSFGLPGTTNAAGQAVAGGTLGGSALSSLAGLLGLSDRRTKEAIEPIGKLRDGTPIYRFRYKGDAIPRVGVMSDEVDPSAVYRHPSGFDMVDYGRVIDRAAAA
jgi:hypothetical protein